MNSRGFAILLLFAVAASVALGLIVERYTAPGFERTFWFAIGLAAILFPAGKFAERRGWVHGVWRAGGERRPSLLDPEPSVPSSAAPGGIPSSPENPPGPMSTSASAPATAVATASATAPAERPSARADQSTAPTRLSSGESK